MEAGDALALQRFYKALQGTVHTGSQAGEIRQCEMYLEHFIGLVRLVVHRTVYLRHKSHTVAAVGKGKAVAADKIFNGAASAEGEMQLYRIGGVIALYPEMLTKECYIAINDVNTGQCEVMHLYIAAGKIERFILFGYRSTSCGREHFKEITAQVLPVAFTITNHHWHKKSVLY